jgi:hypothetical protein
MLTAEMMADRHPSIVGYPNISQLEGFCWEIGPDNSQLLPVLVFREADSGDMKKFMKTDRGRSSSLRRESSGVRNWQRLCKSYTRTVIVLDLDS